MATQMEFYHIATVDRYDRITCDGGIPMTPRRAQSAWEYNTENHADFLEDGEQYVLIRRTHRVRAGRTARVI